MLIMIRANGEVLEVAMDTIERVNLSVYFAIANDLLIYVGY